MEQVGVRVYANEKDENGNLGVASLTLAGQLAVTGIRIAEGKYGIFLKMPSVLAGEGPEGKKYQNVFYPADNIVRNDLTKLVVETYNKAKESENHMAEITTEKQDIPFDVKVSLSEYSGPVKGTACLKIQNVFYVEGIKIRLKAEEDRYYVTMPSYQNKNKEWKSFVYPVNAEFREKLNEGILRVFEMEQNAAKNQNI